MLPLKGTNHRRHDPGCEQLWAGYADCTGKLAVTKLNLTIKVVYGLLNLLGASAKLGS
jgi:hypothetical protein